MTDLKPPPPSDGGRVAVIRDGGGKPPSSRAEPITLQDIADVVQAAVRKAKEGDMYAAEVVRRFWRWRREPVTLDIGEVRTAEQIAEAQGKVLAEAFAGHIALSDAVDLSTLIENRRRALHTLEQQRKLDEMEAFAREHAPGRKGQR